jgi:hypothetical protein
VKLNTKVNLKWEVRDLGAYALKLFAASINSVAVFLVVCDPSMNEL